MGPVRGPRYVVRRLINHGHKLRWGVGQVGPAATARGLARIAVILLRRPAWARTPLGDGGVLGFGVPEQMSPALVVFGRLIDPEYAFLREVSRPGWVHWDVGAAVGQYTVFAGRLPGTTVRAFEPNPGLRASLVRNVAENGLEGRVEIHDVAVTATSGPVTFAAPESPFVGGAVTGAGPGLVVEGRTVDDLLAAAPEARIDVLKVNVAGAEAAVLAGARESIRHGRIGCVVVLVGPTVLEPLREMAGAGYRFFYRHSRTGLLHELAEISAAALAHPPTPARHVIGVHADLVDGDAVLGVPLAPRDRVR